MLKPTPSQPPLALDATTWSSWHHCPFDYWLKHVEGWSAKDEQGPLVHGQALHAGLARWYESKSLDDALMDLRAAWPRAGAEPLELPPMYTLGRAEALLKAYTGYWNGGPGATHDALSPWTRPGEQPFLERIIEAPIEALAAHCGIDQRDLPGDGLGWSAFGIVDMIAEMDGGLWVVDHKTTKDMGERWSYQWRPDVQMLGYALLAEATLQLDRPVMGALINGLKMTEGVAGARGMVFPPADRANVEFRRLPVLFTAEDKRQWVLDRCEAYRTLAWSHRQGCFPRTTDRRQCSGLGRCHFHDACSAQPSQFTLMLSQRFERGTPWDPRRAERI